MTALNALVLGGGGPVGAAWLSAALSELVAAGLPLGESGVVLGTSAGAVSGAWLTMDPDGLPEVPQRMVERARQHAAALAAGQGDQGLFQRLLAESGGDARKIAQAAIATFPPMTAEQGEALWSEMLPEGAVAGEPARGGRQRRDRSRPRVVLDGRDPAGRRRVDLHRRARLRRAGFRGRLDLGRRRRALRRQRRPGRRPGRAGPCAGAGADRRRRPRT
jgi:hypothetical protein